jgi:hypothetical protein
MKKVFILFIISFFAAVSAYAEPLKSEKDIKKLADDFMTGISTGRYKEAFTMMKPYWPLPEAEIDNISYQTESQLKMAADRFGKLIGSEYIQSNRIGVSYIRFIYIQKFANHATRWMIVFYRPLDEWKVNGVVWDDKTYELFGLSCEQRH